MKNPLVIKSFLVTNILEHDGLYYFKVYINGVDQYVNSCFANASTARLAKNKIWRYLYLMEYNSTNKKAA